MAKISKELVFLYGENAKIKIKSLAALFKTSSQRIKYLLKTMEKDGIVHNPHCIFDYSYFGLILFRVYFKGAYISEKHRAEIIKKLTENKYIVAIYELSGEFDLVIELEVPNPSRFNKELKNISNLIQTLRHYKTALNIVTYLYPKYYLTKDEALQTHVPPQIILGGDRDVKNFNESDLAVMKNLLDNPKIRMTTLAKQSGINIKTLKTVLRKLRRENIVRGFKHIIDTNQLDIYKFRLFLKLHNLSKTREDELMTYLLKTKEIVQVNKTVGDWDIEIDIEALNKTRIRQLTIEIRNSFKDIIETFNIMEFYQHYTRAYLQRYIFEEEEIEMI